MHKRPTTLLLHHMPGQTHYDWLIDPPATCNEPDDVADRRLWAARVGLHSRAWADARRLDLTVLSPHRRVYLRYTGPIAADRGWARRVDHGHVFVRQWSQDRVILDVRMHHFAGIIHWRALGNRRCLAVAHARAESAAACW